MKVLVTGGSGFIGTRLVEDLLKENHEVKIFDKRASETYPDLVIIGDVRDKEAMIDACKNMDVIYNLAAEHADNVTPKSLYADVNVGGAKNVVIAAKENNITRIVFTSTVAVYGLSQEYPDESFEPNPVSEYGITKFAAEEIFNTWVDYSTDNSLTIVRPAVVFGENNVGNVHRLIEQIEKGRFVMVGAGNNKKSMGYVGNISHFLATKVNESSGIDVYNFAGKPDLTSAQIVDIITDELRIKKRIPHIPEWAGMLGGYIFDVLSKITGKKFPISTVRIKKFTSDTTVSTEKLLASGFKDSYGLEEGLRRMIKHEFN